MKLNADVLFESLSRQFVVERKGADHRAMSLNPPLFFRKGMEYRDNGVYIGRARELSPPPRNVACLIVCLGEVPIRWDCTSLCVLSVKSGVDDVNDVDGAGNVDDVDMLDVFNVLQAAYVRYDQWNTRLCEILDTTASITELIQETALVFGKPLAFLNNRLELEVFIDPGNEIGSAPLGPLPASRIPVFIDHHKQNTLAHDPFLYTIDDGAEARSVYCANIFKQGTYLGVLLLAMGSGDRSFTKGDLALFDYFCGFINRAVEKAENQLNGVSRQFVTPKRIFRDIFNGLPMSGSQSRAVLRNADEDTGWQCAAIKPMDTANLPLDYLCVLLERQFPHGFALSESPYIALYLPVRKGRGGESDFDKLEEMAEHISLRAGISFVFKNVLDARQYFRQAVHTLEMAILQGEGGPLCHFRDHALPYALKNSVGELSTRLMVSPDLLLLKNNDDKPGGTDYWNTLKVYLDNEMNATQTADDLFIHRTTLRIRLNKIKNVVDLSTPLSRLYIRYCLYLYEMFDPLDE